ncbi:MAG TPA: hypothetical protein VGN57_08850 [Pirellulaceae bacterium]|jgi:hypothetical protein|nr:hypothetical protein [Pirellulaceae bacterium]
MKMISAECQFYQQDRLAVFIESSLAQEEQVIGELQLFAAYTLRILYNLGPSPVAYGLSEMLVQLPAAVDHPKSVESAGAFVLVDHTGRSGKYSFSGVFRYGEVTRFDLSYKGFGWLGRGLGYYAPSSAMGLLRHFVAARVDDPVYIEKLFKTAMYCGMLFNEGSLRVDNQLQAALALSSRAIYEVEG